ncbi:MULTISPECIES: LCP family protein [unclassified Luteococcus]|uniref:LCP family protein n=1 Tax=unclassified Luteococcus TaxID=2639923 RepID=UPI00313BFE80
MTEQDLADQKAPRRGAGGLFPRFGDAIGWTVLGTALPGLGLVRRSRALGLTVLGLFLTSVAFLVFKGTTDLGWFARTITTPRRLRLAAVLLVLGALVWAAVIVGTWLVHRPRRLTGAQRTVASVLVGMLSFVTSAPLTLGGHYALTQAATIDSIFGKGGRSQTRPTLGSGRNVWKDKPRLNILLLGGDSSDFRRNTQHVGVDEMNTDTMILASINTQTGATVLVQLPRNLAKAPFPAGKLRDAYPDGFTNGDPMDQSYALNAVWSNVPKEHPDLFTDTDQPGADALKLSIGEITGLVPDYFALVDLNGLTSVIDAMGGVTVNINQRLPINGSADHPENTTGFLEVGPNQKLNGYHALWYGRSRYMDPLGDFGRMGRQRCLVKAIIDQADVPTMLTKYEAIASASKNMIKTDIPSNVLPEIADLSLDVRDSGKQTSVLFVNGKDGFVSAEPDFPAMKKRVERAIQEAENPPTAAPKPTAPKATKPASAAPTSAEPSPGNSASDSASPSASASTPAAENLSDACAFNPIQQDASPSATPSR